MSVIAEPESLVAEIGETAGAVWRQLDSCGPMSFTRLVKQLGRPRDLVMQAIGWLAREGKLVVREERRGRVVELA